MKIYETSARATGGRNGTSETLDGAFKTDLSIPKAMGGSGNGVNPEQLFAAGYAACFDSALNHVAQGKKIPLEGSAITVGVSLNANKSGGFDLGVTIEAELEGLDQDAAEKLVADAHAVCPYSNAIKGNIEVKPVVRVK
ncbi:organic hydroperoxide resistance protein [Ponticaulis profundi]|uniref:Organic hydroperoxide resistance protein n=1 Tax=Ponticaulis profundi TaxID=2665222 RepID=A0ABW1S5B6_9PROT|tara:strand:- start:222 stop:638 length:417 start_codon:yes stop_codon:yes gene_type:complete